MQQPNDYGYCEEPNYCYQNNTNDDDDEGDYANTDYFVEYPPPPPPLPVVMGYDEYRRQFISE